jgi:hypothetical protein
MRATNSPADGRRKGQSSPMRVPVTRLQRLHANSRRCWSLRRGRQSTSGVTRCRYGIRSLDRLRHLPTLRWSDKHECRRFLLGAARLAVLQLIKLSYVPGVYVRFAAGVIKQAVGGGIDLTTFWASPCRHSLRGLPRAGRHQTTSNTRPRQLSTELITGGFIYVLRAAHNITQNRRHDQSHRSTGEPANGFGLF